MTKDYKEINLIKFHEEFQTEEDCQKELIKLRRSDGFLCSRCKETAMIYQSDIFTSVMNVGIG